MITGDFNGNGITDFFYSPKGNDTYGTLLEFEPYISVSEDVSLQMRQLGGSSRIKRSEFSNFVTGNFNSDEKTDLCVGGSMFLSSGTELKEQDEVSFIYQGHYLSSEDMNGDGQNDITFVAGNKTTTTYYIYDGEIMAVEHEAVGVPTNYVLAEGNYLELETSKNELVFVCRDTIVRISSEIDFSQTALLTRVKSGFDVVTDFEYSTLNNDDIYSVTGNTAFPYQNISRNTTVVSKMRTGYKNTPIDVKTYAYENGIRHKQGLGSCGFEKITVLDSIRNQSTVKTFEPLRYGVLKQMESPVAKVVNNYSVNVQPDKIAKITLTSSAQTDQLKNVTVNKSYLYDSFGNITKESVNYGEDISQVTSNTYNNTETGMLYRLGELASSSVKTSSVVEQATPIDLGGRDSGGATTFSAGLPVSNPIVKGGNFAPANSVTRKTDILYNDKGLPVNKKSYYNSNLVSEETSNYSNVGMLLSLGAKTYSATAALTKTFEYDNAGRVTKETDPTGNFVEYFYNDQGQLELSKDIYGQSTSYEYDNFGRLTKTVSPLGAVKTVNYQWGNAKNIINLYGSPNNAVYYVTTKTVSQSNEMLEPETTVYFDALDREIRTEQLRFDGTTLKTDKVYDSRGRLWKVSLPFKGNAPTLWNVYSYDSFDRPAGIAYASGKQETWSYDENSVTETADGVTSTKNYNAAGQLTSVEDTGGTITYRYRPDGQPESIVTNGITTSFTYDNYGRQLTINDPSAGVETVTYDSHGNVATHKNANNQITAFVYDAYNRLVSKQMPEYATTYGYDAKGNPNSIASNNGRSAINYVFDSYGRLTSEAETFDGKTLAKQYSYSGSRLTAKSYLLNNASIAAESYVYQNGYHTETKLNGSQSVWKITSENTLGETTGAQTGNLTRTYGFNSFGMPIQRQMRNGNTVIQNFGYDFNAATGNLLSRTDNTRTLSESFVYDNLNRLTNFGGYGVTYSGNGNITAKYDLGTYVYDTPSKPYAVSKINYAATSLPTPQIVDHTSFKRPKTIYYGETASSAASLFYNGKEERSMMETSGMRKYYLGNCYERKESGSESKDFLYLCGDYYSSPAVMMRTNNSSWQLYYIGRDYLGSITHVFTESGSLVQELSYDAWGNLRNPATLAVYEQDTQPELFLGRGYTGHEHLQFCGLINMNARLYDPSIGRFLSPDPYVQNPNFTQSYNRYSYVWNNPLKYSDLSGEKVYIWDNDSNCYRDEWGNGVDYSDAYRAMFQSGYFRGGNMFYDGTTYSGSGNYGTPQYVVGGENGAKAGYKWMNFPIITNEKRTLNYVDVNGTVIKSETIERSFGVMGVQVPDMEGWLNRTSTALGFGNLAYTGLEKLTSNSKWWIDTKGQIRSTSLLERGANGKFVRGVQGLRNSQAAATRAAGLYKAAGRLVGGAGLAVTGTQLLTGQISGTEAAIDGLFGVIGFFGPVGTTISLTYFVGKWAYEEISGNTLFDKP